MRINWEGLGVAASLACAIHCALLPLFISSLPLLGIDLVDNIVVELALIGSAFAIGLVALRHGYRLHHHKTLPIILFSTGIALMLVKELTPGKPLWILIPAVGLVLFAHFLNHRLCRKANHCHEGDCKH